MLQLIFCYQITGSARGLGKALAFEFAKNGCRKIICVDVNESLNEKTVDEINEKYKQFPITAVNFRCDVSHLDDIKNLCTKLYEKYETIDIIVNNAGIVYGKPLPNEQEDIVEKVLRVNFMSCYWVKQSSSSSSSSTPSKMNSPY